MYNKQAIDQYLEMARDFSSGLYHDDTQDTGERLPHGGSSARVSFWHGYLGKGKPGPWSSVGGGAWTAGKYFAKEQPYIPVYTDARGCIAPGSNGYQINKRIKG